MADKPKSIQEKVTIRPTPLGARMIQRLGIPHMDKSGELRRLIELGFAAELAGFTLDGSVLRFGGRVWELRSDLDQGEVGGHTPAPQAPVGPAASNFEEKAQTGRDTDAAMSAPGATSAAAGPQTIAPPSESRQAELPGQPESPLLANLRNLSGGG